MKKTVYLGFEGGIQGWNELYVTKLDCFVVDSIDLSDYDALLKNSTYHIVNKISEYATRDSLPNLYDALNPDSIYSKFPFNVISIDEIRKGVRETLDSEEDQESLRLIERNLDKLTAEIAEHYAVSGVIAPGNSHFLRKIAKEALKGTFKLIKAEEYLKEAIERIDRLKSAEAKRVFRLMADDVIDSWCCFLKGKGLFHSYFLTDAQIILDEAASLERLACHIPEIFLSK